MTTDDDDDDDDDNEQEDDDDDEEERRRLRRRRGRTTTTTTTTMMMMTHKDPLVRFILGKSSEPSYFAVLLAIHVDPLPLAIHTLPVMTSPSSTGAQPHPDGVTPQV